MKKNVLKKNMVIYIVFLMVMFLSIGYAAFNSSGYIRDIAAIVRVKADIRVIGIYVNESSNEVVSNYVGYDVKSISGQVYLPYDDSSVTYKVSIANFESPEMGIFDIKGLPDYLEYSIFGYSLKDKICDKDGKCNLGITKDIYITVKYKNDINSSGVTTHNFNLIFDFRGYHIINYENMYGIDYPIEVMDGDKLVLGLEYDNVNLVISNSSGYNYVQGIDYDYKNGIVNIFNVTEDLYIEVNDKILITNVNSIDNVEIIKYFDSRLDSRITLSNSDSSKASYNVTIYNVADYDIVYTGVIYDEYDNDNITLVLSGLDIGDVIKSGESIQFSVIYKYVDAVDFDSENFSNVLNSFLNFKFKKCYSVTYVNVTGTHVNYAIAGETFNVTFSSTDPLEIKMGGKSLAASKYTFTNKVLTIPNVSGVLYIRKKLPYTIKNLVKNGSFENGLTGWNQVGGSSYLTWHETTIAKFGSKAYYRMPSNQSDNYLRQSQSFVKNHKYYFFASAISTTTQPFYADIVNTSSNLTFNAAPQGWKRGTLIYTSAATENRNIHINFGPITDNVIVDGIGMIDLTAAFGSGNEPSLEWCNTNINYFDNSTIVYK